MKKEKKYGILEIIRRGSRRFGRKIACRDNGREEEEEYFMKTKRVFCALAALVISLSAAGCARQPEQEPAPRGKTVVTMMYPLKLSRFEALAEAVCPDIDLQVEPTTTATINGDSERRLRNGHGTDLVVTTLPTGEVREHVGDLSAEDFVSRYQATIMNPVMIGGQARYLPLPGQYSGYILNKTLTERLGKPLPAANDEILALFDAGKEAGVGIGGDGAMFGINIVDPAAFGSYVIGTQIPDFLGGMDGIKWMSNFLNETAGFSGVWNDSLKMLLACVERGYLNAQSLSLTTANVIPVKDRMLEGTLLLSYGNVRLLHKLNEQSDEFDFVMLPFLSDAGNKPWVISSPDAYIGVNSALTGQENRAVRDACMRILELLSTQEGQDAWMEDTSATTSYLVGYEAGGGEVPPGLADCVGGGYVYNNQMPFNVVQYFGRNMVNVLDGKIDMTKALAAVDSYCRHGSADVDYDQSVVGSVTGDLIYENYNTRLAETAIGNLIADAVAEFVQADIGFVNGGSIRGSLYQGDVRGADLAAVCPYENKVILVSADGETIWKMLENGISQTKRKDDIPAGRFLQVSGLRYSYRPMTGERPAELLSVTLPDGSALKPKARYTLAVSDYMAGISGYLDNNGDGFTMLNIYSDTAPRAPAVNLLKETEATCADALKAYFSRHRDEEIDARLEGRITVVNGNG